MSSHLIKPYKKLVLLIVLYGMILESNVRAWDRPLSSPMNLIEAPKSESWISKILSLKNFSLDLDLRSNFSDHMFLSHPQYFQGYFDEMTLNDVGKNFIKPFYNDVASPANSFNGSSMRLIAHYDRAQCFISFGQTNSPSFSLIPQLNIFTGMGVRYQWNDYLTFEIGTTLHLTGPRGKNFNIEKIKPMSDFTEQVNNLSKPVKNSFAEGLFTVIYHFCRR